MEKFDEIKEKLDADYSTMRELKTRIFSLEREKEQILIERMKQLIGLCFIDNKKNCYMITNVPQRPYTLNYSSINFYQIPVYKIDKKTREMTYETFYSHAYESENPREVLKTEIFEFISPDIFRQEAMATIQNVITETVKV